MNRILFKSTIKSLFIDKLNFDLSDAQIDCFYDYMNLLVVENEKYNLTSIVEPLDIIYKHFFDSCQILKFRDLCFSKKSFIDIGCGAGFPSLPISILFPNSIFCVVDSVNKKINFISKLIKLLNLENVQPIHSRAEDLSRNISYMQKYDYSLSRAVSNISVVLEYSSQFLKIGGMLFVYKMANSHDELSKSVNSQSILKYSLLNSISYTISDNSSERVIYCFLKQGISSRKYPRKSGIPTKSPL